jgi:hypothetical protein
LYKTFIMENIFEKYQQDYKEYLTKVGNEESMRYYAFLQIKLLEEINNKLGELLKEKRDKHE